MNILAAVYHQRLLIMLLCIIVPICITAGELAGLNVQRDGNEFTVFITSLVKAPCRSVYESLTDFARLNQISDSVRLSEIVAGPDKGSQRVHTVTHLCVFFICRDLSQVQDMWSDDTSLEIHARVVPDQSDFNSGAARWLLTCRGEYTHMVFKAELTPKFWVPPLIGIIALKAMLRREAEKTLLGLEDIHFKQTNQGFHKISSREG